MRPHRFIALVAPIIVSFTAVAQGPAQAPPAATQQAALAKLNTGDYKGALQDCQKLATEYPTFARAQFCIGMALIGLERHREALAALDVAEKRGAVVPQVAFRKGMALAALGEADGAFAELQRASDAGMVVTPVPVETDPSFARIRNDPRLKSFLTAIDRNLRPCKYDARFRAFDFWIGDWDVRPNGAPATQPPAKNIVTSENDGCIIMEHWTAVGSNGQSFNLYDRSYDVWRQTWVDNSGGQHDYRGAIQNGNMVFRGEIPPLPGQTARQNVRLTFFPLHPDTVRQLSEVTTDNGVTWSIGYDFIYVRHKN